MRVLVVEDDKEINKFLKNNLAAEMYAVDTAFDGERGLRLAMENDYDVILLDNLLPKKMGFEICRRLRAAGKLVPILVLSVRSETDMKVKLLNAGADDYLIKPFSLEELLARVRALLRRPTEIHGDVLAAGDLVFDTTTHSVRRGAREIRLTRKEYMLLEYMLRNQGVVLSRGMLMEHAWDMNSDPFSNTLEVHLANLRKKIDIEGAPRLIHTVQGRGYRLSANAEEKSADPGATASSAASDQKKPAG